MPSEVEALAIFLRHTQMILRVRRARDRTLAAQRVVFKSLPAEGLEPTRSFDHWILSPARLPIPPRRQREPETSEKRWNLKRLQRLEVAWRGENFTLCFLAMQQLKSCRYSARIRIRIGPARGTILAHSAGQRGPLRARREIDLTARSENRCESAKPSPPAPATGLQFDRQFRY